MARPHRSPSLAVQLLLRVLAIVVAFGFTQRASVRFGPDSPDMARISAPRDAPADAVTVPDRTHVRVAHVAPLKRVPVPSQPLALALDRDRAPVPSWVLPEPPAPPDTTPSFRFLRRIPRMNSGDPPRA